MNLITVATIIFGTACGFGTGVWFIVAIWHWKRGHKGLCFWYLILALAYLVCTVIIVGRTLGNFQEIPRGFSLILLAPIFAVPPAIQLAAWLKARSLVRETLDRAKEAHSG